MPPSHKRAHAAQCSLYSSGAPAASAAECSARALASTLISRPMSASEGLGVTKIELRNTRRSLPPRAT
eukprot:820268-Prymnesium_polylepis.4